MDKVIGEAAGKVWQALSKGPVVPSELPKVAKLPVDLTNQAIGWLAREGKLTSVTSARGTALKLK